MSERIRVLIVDDHLMVRRGLATFLRAARDLELVGEAVNGAQAIGMCEKTHPHVILMDLRMPEMDGIAATRMVRQAHPEVQVIALTSSHEDELVAQALRAGAIGYLLKDVGVGGLGDAIRAARAGRATLATQATQALVRQASAAPGPTTDTFTQREREVLTLLVKGLSNAQIAERLVLSRSTVNFHVGNLLSKLEVGSRTEAVSVALQRRLTE
jgi:two-component system, NarL family, response regulator LiaR